MWAVFHDNVGQNECCGLFEIPVPLEASLSGICHTQHTLLLHCAVWLLCMQGASTSARLLRGCSVRCHKRTTRTPSCCRLSSTCWRWPWGRCAVQDVLEAFGEAGCAQMKLMLRVPSKAPQPPPPHTHKCLYAERLDLDSQCRTLPQLADSSGSTQGSHDVHQLLQ